MRVSAIQQKIYTNQMKHSGKKIYTPSNRQNISFNGWKGAAKGAGILGAIGAVTGAVTGAVLTGGASIIPTILYFAGADAVTGAMIGHTLEEEGLGSSSD